MWLDLINIDDSWKGFLTKEVIDELAKIENYVGNDYTPESSKVLRFMGLDLNKMKVVILGQDPYKPLGVATGRSFESANLYNWDRKSVV